MRFLIFISFLMILCLFNQVNCEENHKKCPERCVCQQTTVRCMRQHLDHVPEISKDTTILDLRFNRITEIPSNLLGDGYTKLHTVFLNENQIQTIHENAFSKLTSLKFLFLNKNRINQILPNAFKNLNKLNSLYLQSNNLSEINSEMFSNLPVLERLFLNDNKIKKIPKGSFNNLPELKRLRLDGNPIQCDCSIMWFMKMVKNENDINKYAAICQTPNDMIGKNLNSVEYDDFNCDKPEIVEEPKDTTVTIGRSTILRCKVSGDPQPHITWLHNSIVIPHNGPRKQILNDGTLLIENFTISDAGNYKCKAINDMGETESNIIKVNYQEIKNNANSEVNNNNNNKGAPKIIVPPSNLNIQLNERIVLHCLTSGYPQPHISWFFNDQPIRESQTGENKIHIMTNGTLIIENSSIENEGNYRCEIVNTLGKVTASSDVYFDDVPRITIAPDNQNIKSGEQIVLQCEADGIPMPTISWLHNGTSLLPSNRVFFANENTELHIEYVKPSDSGIYTCVADNTLGSVDAEALVTVQHAQGPPKLEYEPYDDEVVPGTVIEIPCKPEEEGDYQITWQKDGRTLTPLPRYRFSPSGSLYISNVTEEDTGRYECSVKNKYGRATASGLITVRNEKSLAPGDRFVRIAFAEATQEIDKAINQTITSLFDGTPTNHGDLFRLFNYPNAPQRELARAAEIYERTLTNIRKHVEDGSVIKANITDFDYKDILSEEHLELIARLSGCMSHRITPNCTNICYHAKYRSLDGTCNNLENPTWGASLTGFRRLLSPIYENGYSMPIGWTKGKLYNGFVKPPSRLVSTNLITTNEITPDSQITHMMMQWGQFLDHDLDHAIPSVSSESWDGVDCKKTCDYAAPCYPIEIPEQDPRVKNRRCIDFVRSSAICGSGVTSLFFQSIQPREQINQLTSYIDASQVYGYTEEFARDLREQTDDIDDGLLREGVHFPNQKAMLPFASPADGIDCRRDLDESNVNCFVAGDIRVNEQIGLLAMHVIWFREHNRIAREFKSINSHWSGDIIYNEARKIVGAQMQHITYKHWLPRILGKVGMKMLGEYQGYNPKINPSISNEFATAALRFGHSLINPILHRFDDKFNEIPQGHLPLNKAFFAPWRVVYEGGVDPLMRGLFSVPAKLKMPEQNLNADLTEKLFKTAHAVALDLAAMNIQRARDHGIPGYNDYRKLCNLTYAETVDDLKNEISSEMVRNKLKEFYGHPSNIDIWVGGILEDQVEDGKVGPLFRCLLVEQFRNLRDGDRFYYENPGIFKPKHLEEIKKSTLGRVLCDNGDNITQVTDDVFLLPKLQGGYKNCDKIERIDLRKWIDCSECANTCTRNSNLGRARRSIMSLSVDHKIINNHIDEDDMNEERIDGLEALVERFEKSLKQIRRKLKKLEQSCTNVKPNKHGHCMDDTGIRRLNNEIWNKDECTKCVCVKHQINCTTELCPKIQCAKNENLIKQNGLCCPICELNKKNENFIKIKSLNSTISSSLSSNTPTTTFSSTNTSPSTKLQTTLS